MARRTFAETCTIYSQQPGFGVVPVALNVPCTVVARYAQWERTDRTKYQSATHYLTMPYGVQVADLDAQLGGTVLLNNRYHIVKNVGAADEFVVLFVEVRKAGAPDQYLRVYCWRRACQQPYN